MFGEMLIGGNWDCESSKILENLGLGRWPQRERAGTGQNGAGDDKPIQEGDFLLVALSGGQRLNNSNDNKNLGCCYLFLVVLILSRGWEAAFGGRSPGMRAAGLQLAHQMALNGEEEKGVKSRMVSPVNQSA